MQHDRKTLSNYRLERAAEDLAAAQSNLENGFYKAAINRSYYCIFHAIRAVNIMDGFDASKHSSVIAHFNQYYVHTGKFAAGTYKVINLAYRIREKCDYDDFFIASREDALHQTECAEDFLKIVRTFLENWNFKED